MAISTTVATAEVVPQFIAGRWQQSAATSFSAVHNPSTGEVIARTPAGGAAEVDAAVAAAAKAFVSWSITPVTRRAKILLDCRQRLQEHFDELCRLICTENGKTFEEARGDVHPRDRGAGIRVRHPASAHGRKPAATRGTLDGETCARTRSGMRGNHAVQLPGHGADVDVPAGDRVRKHLRAQAEREGAAVRQPARALFHEAGLPEGVLNIVHGDQEVVEALLDPSDVRAVSFVGSTAMRGTSTKLATEHGKRVQAAGGAKNHLLVMPDADGNRRCAPSWAPPSAAPESAAWPVRC